MAASVDTLKEFLVALGFKIDEGGYRNFTNLVAAVTVRVTELGAAVEATAAAMVYGTAKMAEGLENVYFASQRTKSSVKAIESLSFALSNFGTTAGAARESMENVAQFLRSSPGASGVLSTLGVNPNEGAARIMQDLGAKFREMPFYRAKAYASLMGIDERTLIAMRNSTGQFSAAYNNMLAKAGVNAQAAAKSSHEFMNQVRLLTSAFDILGMRVTYDLTKRMSYQLEQFRRLFVENFDKIGRAIDGFVRGLVWLGGEVFKFALAGRSFFNAIVGWYESLDPKTKALAKDAALIAAGIKLVDTAMKMSLVGRVVALGAALVALYNDYEVWKHHGKSLIDWGKWKPEIDLAKSGIQALKDVLDGIVTTIENLKKAWQWLDRHWWTSKQSYLNSNINKTFGTPVGGAASLVPGAAMGGTSVVDTAPASGGGGFISRAWRWVTGGGKSVNKESIKRAYAWLLGHGYSKAEADGIVANMVSESGGSINAVGDGGKAYGLFQWHPDRQALFQKVMGHNIRGSSFDDQMKFFDWELHNSEARAGAALAGTHNAFQAGYAISNYDLRPANKNATSLDRGYLAESYANRYKVKGGVTVEQQNNITVHGGGAPHQTSQAVQDALRRSNQDLVRNMQGAVR